MKRSYSAALLAVAAGCLVAASISTPARAATPSGAQVYADHCAICHGDNRQGNLPAFPPLTGITHRMNEQQITAQIHNGKGRMPAQPTLQGEELKALLQFLTTSDTPAAKPAHAGSAASQDSSQVQAGKATFQQNCAFCHGRDAMGGESGPDLTQSKIVAADRNGNLIGNVVRQGRPDQKMPAFNFSDSEIQNLAAYIHSQTAMAARHKGKRRGVTVEDLQTGNAAAGKAYFGHECAQCHSASGDLAHVASRYQGLLLEERMLYPRGAKSKVTVTLANGQTVAGTLAYQDEFTIALTDAQGNYHSWPVSAVHFKVDSPVDGHIKLFPRYTDDDVHNLMAYLQTLR